MATKPDKLCFGKHSPRFDARTLQLRRYLAPNLPAPPAACDWTGGLNQQFGMMLNNSIGDCAIACPAHMEIGWIKCESNVFWRPSDQQILQAYEAVSGYRPGNPSSDVGCQVIDVLNYWRKTGIGGRKIQAYAQLQPSNTVELRQAVKLFGSAYLGFALPNYLGDMLQQNNYCDWVMPTQQLPASETEPGGLGGHAVPVLKYDANWLYIVTWGQVVRVSYPFYLAYCDEAYAVLCNLWTANGSKSPDGLNLQALQADLQALPH